MTTSVRLLLDRRARSCQSRRWRLDAVAIGMRTAHGRELRGVAGGLDVEMIRQPVGVVAAVTPFDFPTMIPLLFLPFAVAAGNAFILKPSEQDPLAGERIVELSIMRRSESARLMTPRARRDLPPHDHACGSRRWATLGQTLPY